MKVFELVQLCEKRLAGEENPRLEAEWLTSLSLGINRSQVSSGAKVGKRLEARVLKNLERRAKGEPLAYIVGSANFYGYNLFVNRGVLIPRPETEELVLLAKSSITKESKVLDIGTGSGAIAIAIKKQTDADVFAVDISKRAIKIAEKNAKSNGADIKFAVSDLFSALDGLKFDVIIANPPYISPKTYEKLDKTVKNYEPKLALVGGKDGMAFYKKIIRQAPNHLSCGGKIFFEIGYDQAQDVKALLEKDFENIVIKKDLEGNDRMVFASLSRRK